MLFGDNTSTGYSDTDNVAYIYDDDESRNNNESADGERRCHLW